MANKKISLFDSAISLQNNDLLVIAQYNPSTGEYE